MKRHFVICDRYDVVVLPFPFDEIPVRKRRPAAVISGRSFNEANGNTIVAMITTAKETKWPSDAPIADLEKAGLLVPCVVRMRLQTMPNSLIVRNLGSLGGRDRLLLDKQLADILI